MAEIRAKVIIPKKMNTAAMERALLAGLKETEKGILKDFLDTVETWENKPEFKHDAELKAAEGRAFVETDDEIYTYINNGTKHGYPIPKTPKPYPLRFKWGGKGSYKPKTKPGRFKSTPGGMSPGAPEVHPWQVWHPGIDARKFDELIAHRWQSLFQRAMNYAMADAAKASGHGIP